MCWYRPLVIINEQYILVPGEQEFINQGYIFSIGDFYETLSCALAINSIGKRPETLKLLSPTECTATLNEVLNVEIHVYDIKKDSWWGSEVWVSREIFKSSGKKEIYLGKHEQGWFVLSPWIKANDANLYRYLFMRHGKYQ